MSEIDIKALIEQGIPGSTVYLSGEGCNFSTVVISEAFEDKSLLQKQRMVYGTVGDLISNGTIHALSIKAYTPAQWDELDEKPFN